MKAMNVYYDFDEGEYYKIDKQTGVIMKSSRNGKDPIKFKAEYTGSDYQLRKKVERDLSPSSIIKEPYHVHYEHKHTQFSQKRQSIDKNEKSAQKMSSIKKLRLTQLKRSSASGYSTDRISNKLTDYTKLKQNLHLQNHSPRMNIQGSLPILQLPTEYRHKIQSSKTFKIPKQTKSLAHLRSSQANIPENLITKNQIKKEKKLFLKYNPQFQQPTNERQLREMVDRKKNLKILEKLSLLKNDRITSQVYE